MKIIAIILCFILCMLIGGGILAVSATESSTSGTYAMIIMPDGSIIKGECSAFAHTYSYVIAKINGVEYHTDRWRIVIWKK